MPWSVVKSEHPRHPCALLARAAVFALLVLLAACGGTRKESPAPPGGGVYKLGRPYQVGGRWYHPEFDPEYDRIGLASWYGREFQGRRTANGEIFDRNRPSAAHPTLPLPSLVEVTNLENGRRLVVRVNDRGPFVDGRLIDLSEAAARALGFRDRGLARVRVRFLRLADDAVGVPPRPKVRRTAGAAPAPAAVGSCDTGESVYLVQVAAFRDGARADRVARQLRALGPVRVEHLAGLPAPMVRVRLGPVSTADGATRLVERARRLGYREAFVIAERRDAGCGAESLREG